MCILVDRRHPHDENAAFCDAYHPQLGLLLPQRRVSWLLLHPSLPSFTRPTSITRFESKRCAPIAHKCRTLVLFLSLSSCMIPPARRPCSVYAGVTVLRQHLGSEHAVHCKYRAGTAASQFADLPPSRNRGGPLRLYSVARHEHLPLGSTTPRPGPGSITWPWETSTVLRHYHEVGSYVVRHGCTLK